MTEDGVSISETCVCVKKVYLLLSLSIYLFLFSYRRPEPNKKSPTLNNYQKKIAQLERKDPKISYKVKAFPTSKAGELAFGTSGSNKYQDIYCTITFFYKDPNESEEERLRIVDEKIPGILGRNGVFGFNDEGEA